MPDDTTVQEPSRGAFARRHLLRLSLAAGLAPLATVAEAARWRPPREWRLTLNNIATGEVFDDVYCVDGVVLDGAAVQLEWLLRDHYCDRGTPIDTELLHRLYQLQCRLDRDRPLEILSGYRTPETNRRLCRAGLGASPRSLHVEGRAVDIRQPGLATHALYRAALDTGDGGSGFYPRGGFVHIDCGRNRQWMGA